MRPGKYLKLKLVARTAITNSETRAAIHRVLKYPKDGKKNREAVRANPEGMVPKLIWDPPKWPGIEFPMDSDEAKLLLQTPNGKGVAWLLIQHKMAFGLKCVEKIRVWNALCEGKNQPCMLFHIEPVSK